MLENGPRAVVLNRVLDRHHYITRNGDTQASPQSDWIKNAGVAGPEICVLTSPPGAADA